MALRADDEVVQEFDPEQLSGPDQIPGDLRTLMNPTPPTSLNFLEPLGRATVSVAKAGRTGL
jgi:hypothetical protein